MEQGSEHSLIQQLQGKIAGLEASASREQVMSHSIRELLKGGAAYVGPAFFPAVVQNLSSVLSAEFVFVGRLSEDSKSVETISLWGDGQILPNMAYDLFNTPCANVIGEDVCVHPSCVTAAFPEDQLLIDMRIEGYVGIPLFGSDGAPIGIMVALYREPVPDSEFASTLLLVFAARTSAEMERIHQDEERRKLEENLLQNQKLEGLGVLAGGIAHDFNNILMTILASADLAELALEPGHPAVSRIHLIAKTASQAGELCRQLLAYAGKGQFELKGHNLSHLVRDLEQLLRTSATSKVTLRLDLHPNLPSVHVDASQIRQVLLNLVLNASEAMEGNAGTIRVSTGIAELGNDTSPASHLALPVNAGDYVYLEVSDTGSGMDKELVETIFDPFFSTKFAGRGLGLASTIGILKGHRGSIEVDSTPGKGSRFRVLLPSAKEAAVAHKRVESEWSGTGTALIVDDQPHIRQVTCQLMEFLGFQTLAAADGLEGTKLYEEHQDEIKVVLLDLTMPNMDGEATFQAMRAVRQDIPVILMSGFSDQGLAIRGEGAGQPSFIQKPFRLEELRLKVRDAVSSV